MLVIQSTRGGRTETHQDDNERTAGVLDRVKMTGRGVLPSDVQELFVTLEDGQCVRRTDLEAVLILLRPSGPHDNQLPILSHLWTDWRDHSHNETHVDALLGAHDVFPVRTQRCLDVEHPEHVRHVEEQRVAGHVAAHANPETEPLSALLCLRRMHGAWRIEIGNLPAAKAEGDVPFVLRVRGRLGELSVRSDVSLRPERICIFAPELRVAVDGPVRDT